MASFSLLGRFHLLRPFSLVDLPPCWTKRLLHDLGAVFGRGVRRHSATKKRRSRSTKTPSPSCSSIEAATLAEGAVVAKAVANADAVPPAVGGANPSPAFATKCMNVLRVRGSRAPTPIPDPCPRPCSAEFPPSRKPPRKKSAQQQVAPGGV